MRSEANWSSAWHRHPLSSRPVVLRRNCVPGRRVGDLSDVPAQCACFDEYPRTAGALPDDGRYVQSLALERRYGPDRGPDTQKEREAAQSTWDV